MKFKVGRYAIEIRPEDEKDVAYIEDTLGLKEDGASIKLVRVNVIDGSDIAELSTETDFIRSRLRAKAAKISLYACAVCNWIPTVEAPTHRPNAQARYLCRTCCVSEACDHSDVRYE